MQTVNEGSSAWLTIQFKDKLGALAAPTAVTYRVDCMTTKTNVRASTPMSPPFAGQMEIALTSGDTLIRNISNAQEVKRVTVIAEYGSSNDQATAEYDYAVNNLKFY